MNLMGFLLGDFICIIWVVVYDKCVIFVIMKIKIGVVLLYS